MKYKSQRVEREWRQAVLDGRLIVTVVAAADHIALAVAGIELTLTSVLRTAQEQQAICTAINNTRAKTGQPPIQPYRSVHEFWRGADARSTSFAPEQAEEIARRANELFHYGGRFTVAAVHNQGTAPHLHFQVPRTACWAPAGKGEP
jgi:hypothetical protein